MFISRITHLSLFIISLCSIAKAQTVVISQYVEACSGTTPKSIELWNPTGTDIDMSVTPIVVLKGTNGNTPSADITINSGTLKAGEVLIVGTTDTTGTTCHTYVSKSFTFNGDDALQVTLDGVLTDVFGNPGSDPGSAWSGGGVSTRNSNIQLKSGITTGDTFGWTDPSTRFELVSGTCGLTGFGIPPGGCSSTPVLTSDVSSITSINYPSAHGGPSDPRTITLTGDHLGTAQATVTAPGDFEVSTTLGGSYSSSFLISPVSEAINQTFYVRLKSGKSLGAYSGNLSITHDSVSTLTIALSGSVTTGNDTIKSVNYNLLQYPGSTGQSRNTYIRAILTEMNPHIISFNEVSGGTSSFNTIRDSLVKEALPHFNAGTFIQSTNDMSSALFYDSTRFRFVSNTPIVTTLRDISEYTLIHLYALDTFRVYVVHLKASTGSSNELQRAAEVHELRSVTDALPNGSFFVVQGDFNIYNSDEDAYDSLVTETTGVEGHVVDPITMVHTTNWNNASNAIYHTQSTRTRSFGGGATGGLDDRFDMVLHSKALSTVSDVYFLNGSYRAYGNDGNHYNDSINSGSNDSVSSNIAEALHLASDHLPVLSEFVFEDGGTTLPVSYTRFRGYMLDNKMVELQWTTASEMANSGFEVQRRTAQGAWKVIGFMDGNGTTSTLSDYTFVDDEVLNDVRYYRLRQIDYNGRYEFSRTVRVKALESFSTFNIFPNPFTDQLTVQVGRELDTEVRIGLTDLSGRTIAIDTEVTDSEFTLHIEDVEPGIYALTIAIGPEVNYVKVIRE